MLLFSTVAKSQVMWILIFGDKLSNDKIQSGINVSLAAVNYEGLDGAKYLPTWALGGFTDIQLKNHWAIHADVVFKSPTGAKSLNDYFSFDNFPDTLMTEKDIRIENVTFSIPLHLEYQTKYFGFGVGPAFAVTYRSRLRLVGKNQENDRILISRNNIEKVKKFDVGISTMLEFYLSPEKKHESMRLGVRYYYGLLDALKDVPGAHNSVFYLNVGIPIIPKN
jgi:hypothetical protein